MIIQRSEEWFQARLGKATASSFHNIVKSEKLAGWKNYRTELALERITGVRQEGYTSTEMQWGIDTEPLARLHYVLATKNEVTECGFFEHPTLAAGASPDGLLGDDGGLEIKCPNSATHIQTLRTGKIPDLYVPQVQGGMYITGRKYWDYVSFDPRLPKNAALFIIRAKRDDDYIEMLEGRLKLFLKDVEEEMEFVQSYGTKTTTTSSGR